VFIANLQEDYVMKTKLKAGLVVAA